VHDRAAPRATPGRRTALALVGPAHEQVTRGDVVVSGEGWRASRAVDVTLTMLPEAAAKLKSRLRVRVNHGTAEVLARVVLPAPDAGAAGPAAAAGRVAARLLLESPLVARAGDRFVVRSYSPVTTIGGGVVVDPWADERILSRARGKQSFPSAPGTDAGLLTLLVGRRGQHGIARGELEVAAGMDARRLAAALGAAMTEDLVEADGRLFAATEVIALAERLADVLVRFHAEHPLEAGMQAQSWRAAAGSAPDTLVDLTERRLAAERRVLRDGSLVKRAQWAPKLGGATERLRTELLEALRAADAEPPSTAELAAAHAGSDVPGLLRLMAREGVVVAVGKERFYEAGALARERERVVTLLTELGSATPAALRDRLGRSRKWLIPLLEWCDTQGITVRKGDGRVLGGVPRA